LISKEAALTDLLIHNVDPHLMRRIEESARKNNRSLSEEAKEILSRVLAPLPDNRNLGTLMFDSIRPEDRGDDLVFEYRGNVSEPPNFE
jgi:plasmid stability protein